MDGELLLILILFSPIILGIVIYFIGWCIAGFAEWKEHKDRVARGIYGTLPDWVGQMDQMYESPNDWESDNKMTDEYECPHCGAQHQRKVICEYCKSRNEQKAKKNSNTQRRDTWSSETMFLNW
jgi:hypothetical protein